MEIKHLKKMEKNPEIAETSNIGLPIEKITVIEQQINKKLPAVYREFLYLGGNGANMIADFNNGCYIDETPEWPEQQQRAREQLEEDGVKIERDFWVFADYGREQWHFFYFDEGDDPPVYYYCSYFTDKEGDEYPGIKRIADSFSKYINAKIDDKKKNGY